MTMHKRLILALMIFIYLVSCTDKNSKLRGDFLSGCVTSGLSKSQCSCMFFHLESLYSSEDLLKINYFQSLPEHMKTKIIEISENCK